MLRSGSGLDTPLLVHVRSGNDLGLFHICLDTDADPRGYVNSDVALIQRHDLQLRHRSSV